MKKEPITFMGVGDIIIDREKPETVFRYVEDVLRAADITYANCDQAYADKGTPSPRQASHSTSKNIPALLHAGIDAVSLANNHSLDWGVAGILETMDNLKKAGLPYVGTGRNLAEARKPVILERKGTKVGLLAYSSVHHEGYEATEERPGLVPIRVWTIYQQVDYQPGTPPKIITIAHKEDLAAMIDDIKKLKKQVDVVVVYFHWGQHLLPRLIPMYCFELGHEAIDAGADLIIGTHTHILKGIEMYKGKAIFYSLGNFVLELGQHMRDHAHVQELDRLYRTSDWTERMKTMIARAVIEDGKIARVSYIPCYINENSEPVIVKKDEPKGQEVFDYVADISRSEELPVSFTWDGDSEVLVTPPETP
jgi:poly-gamma-glutamate capsule biosynthesis protein CapA/YwtB (metallophosphatase superfamily)